MAITFLTPIPIDKWLFSEENRIAEFRSDYAEQPVFCDISVSTSQLRVYPLPNGSFWVNLKEFISVLLREYDDDVDPTTINPLDVNTFVFDWSKVLLNEQITFDITFIDDTTESTSVTPFFILGSEKLKQFKQGRTVRDLDYFVASPLKRNTANTHHLRYWQGYPFDFGLTRDINAISTPIQIQNITNGVALSDIQVPYNVNRIFISDGDTNVTLEDYLPLVVGYNSLKIGDDLLVDIWKHESDCGVYMKWLNQFGGYNYWLFNRQEQIQSNTRDIGIINNDFSNLDETVSPFKSLGRTSFDSHKIKAEFLTDNDMDILSGILLSPKVYIFAGERFSRNSFNNWIEVSIKNTRETIQQAREQNNELMIEFTMPNDYTITL